METGLLRRSVVSKICLLSVLSGLFLTARVDVGHAVVPPVLRLDCGRPEYPVDWVLCANSSYRIIYNKVSAAWSEAGAFLENGGASTSTFFERRFRRFLSVECHIPRTAHGGQIKLSGQQRDCLQLQLKSKHIDIRCPLFINSGDEKSQAEQEKWLWINRRFCWNETGDEVFKDD